MSGSGNKVKRRNTLLLGASGVALSVLFLYCSHILVHDSARLQQGFALLHVYPGTIQSHMVSSLERDFIFAPAPFPNTNISTENPVILFHQRKAGGTSLRQAIANGARNLKMPYFIPCSPPVSCDTYSFTNTSAAIYAGHFSISEVKHLLRHVPLESALHTRQRHNVTCLTNFREPLSRVESCFYYRFIRKGIKYSCMNDIPVHTLRKMLVYGVDEYGDGCLDEPFRILSGITDKRLLRRANDMQSPEFLVSYQNSLHWLSRCHILMLGDKRTFELSGNAIPELKHALDSLGFANSNNATKCQLDKEHASLLHELTEAERRLYAAVQRRVDYLVAMSQGGQSPKT